MSARIFKDGRRHPRRRPATPLGRCLSCGTPLTMLGRQFIGDRFCEDCDPYQTRWAVVDTWRSILEAMRVIREAGK